MKAEPDAHTAELIRQADCILNDEAYTTSEKIQAVEFLERVPCDQAIQILKRVAELYSVAVKHQHGLQIVQMDEELADVDISQVYHRAHSGYTNSGELDDSPGLEVSYLKTLRVAERAARALAHNFHSEGIDYLRRSLAKTQPDAQTRFMGALGLGTCISPEAFSALAEALDDPDETVRERVVKSIKESLDVQLGADPYHPEVQKLLIRLAARGAGLDVASKPLTDKSAVFARFVYQQYQTNDSQLWLINQLPKVAETLQMDMILDMLGVTLSAELYHRLADLLLLPEANPEMYRRLAKLLRQSRDRYVVKVAERVAKEKRTLCSQLLRSFPYLQLSSVDHREHAARVILDTDNGEFH